MARDVIKNRNKLGRAATCPIVFYTLQPHHAALCFSIRFLLCFSFAFCSILWLTSGFPSSIILCLWFLWITTSCKFDTISITFEKIFLFLLISLCFKYKITKKVCIFFPGSCCRAFFIFQTCRAFRFLPFLRSDLRAGSSRFLPRSAPLFFQFCPVMLLPYFFKRCPPLGGSFLALCSLQCSACVMP